MTETFERAALDGKDRNQLVAIAETLGQKPPSRMKKAEILELIEELASAGDSRDDSKSNSDNSNSDKSAQKTAETASTASSPEGSASDGSASDGFASEGSASVGSSEPTGRGASTGSASSSAGGSSASEKPSKKKNAGKQSQDNSSQGGRSTNGGGRANNSNRSGGNNSSGGSTNDSAHDDDDHSSDGSGGDAGSDNAKGSGSGEDPETGNRKRRRGRRGRERDDLADWDGDPIIVSGLLDLRDDGYGFLRVKGFLPSKEDVYISVKQCRQIGLRKGDHVEGEARPPSRQEKNPAMTNVLRVNGIEPDAASERSVFDDLTATYPNEALGLSTDASNVVGSLIDVLSPLGKGQRNVIVAPARSQPERMLSAIANAVEQNHPDVHLIVLMIDQRPEDVTVMRNTLESGEVVASTFDASPEEHISVAELTIEHAKRLVEYGNDVVVLFDGLTRLTRAYNLGGNFHNHSKTLPGGLEAAALAPTKRAFGAARCVEEGGSLTMVATMSKVAGSLIDSVINEEFEGVSTSQIVLSADAVALEMFPPIDPNETMTINREKLESLSSTASIKALEARLGACSSVSEQLTWLDQNIKKSGTGAAFFASLS